MILNAYSIFDHKAVQYFPPFYSSTDGAATRSLRDLVDDGNSNVGRHPGDYTLFCVGTWDDSKGRFEPIIPLRHIIDAVALVAPASNTLPFPQKKEA